MHVIDAIQALASIATAVGLFMAWWQIRLTKQQAVTTFEDQLAAQYREIIRRLPVDALLGEALPSDVQQDVLTVFFHYIDLTNEQVFLRSIGRVTNRTWANWCDGIEGTLRLTAFATAWVEIKRRAPKSFEELHRLEADRFQSDPVRWRTAKRFKLGAQRYVQAEGKSESAIQPAPADVDLPPSHA